MCWNLDSSDLSRASQCWLISTVVFAQACGISVVILIGVWLGKYLGGFAWDSTGKEFNIHPLCMALGLIYVFGTSTIVYRTLRTTKKFYVKLIHAILNLIAIVFTIVGLIAVFQFHNANHIKNLYSLHSWCGILTISLFFLQYVAGFVAFLFPKLSENNRSNVLPFHRYLGGAILVLAAITVISGINEKLIFTLKGNLYQNLPTPALLGNSAGIMTVVFVMITLYILQKQEWKRNASEDYEEME